MNTLYHTSVRRIHPTGEYGSTWQSFTGLDVTSKSHTATVGLTYYELFGVSQTATNEEIERAYRNASKAFHPDAHGPVANSALFREVTEARDTLTDPIERRKYDNFLTQTPVSRYEPAPSDRPPGQHTRSGNPYRPSSTTKPTASEPKMRRSFSLLILAVTMYILSRGIIQFGYQAHLSFIAFFGHQIMACSAIPMIAFFIVPKDRVKRIVARVSKFLSTRLAFRSTKTTKV
jgi:hypothetical protein